MTGLRDGFAAWRRLGPRRGTAAAARAAARPARTAVRRARVRARPVRSSARDAARALGDRSAVEALRGPVLAAMPAVASWERQLDPALVARAEAIRAHRFDLLGSGPVELGPDIDWHADFKTGRRWPAEHISRIPIAYPDRSDIKVPWELSRFQHLPLLAAAHRVTGDERFLDEIGAQLSDWIAANPVEIGVNWACTMDVAIRAANWVAALALCAEAARDRPWLDAAVASLLDHGRFVRSHLEGGEVRGNHYLADVVGLMGVAALFSGSATGRRWAVWGAGELEREMAHQIRADGCDHEMSLPYHHLVLELFASGSAAADALVPGALSPAFRSRLELMRRFAADTARPDGSIPQMGDADSGRFLPLGGYGLQARVAEPPASGGHAAYREGGWYVMRHRALFALVRCGDVGLYGVGAHAHNDQLSFELCLGVDALVVDPGSYVYTADPAARNAFRSTAAHSTLQVGGAEQNPLRSDYLFALPDRTGAETLAFEADGPRAVFRGRHHGYAPTVHEREIRFDGEALELRVIDTVHGPGGQELRWSLPLAPCAASAGADGSVQASFAGCALDIEAPGLDLVIEDGWVSPAYGVRVPAPVVRGLRSSRAGEDRQELVLRIRPSGSP